MNFNEGTIIQIATYLISAFVTGGTILWTIKELEKKVEKHNNLIERMYKVEESVKSAHKRLDGLDKVMRNV